MLNTKKIMTASALTLSLLGSSLPGAVAVLAEETVVSTTSTITDSSTTGFEKLATLTELKISFVTADYKEITSITKDADAINAPALIQLAKENSMSEDDVFDSFSRLYKNAVDKINAYVDIDTGLVIMDGFGAQDFTVGGKSAADLHRVSKVDVFRVNDGVNHTMTITVTVESVNSQTETSGDAAVLSTDMATDITVAAPADMATDADTTGVDPIGDAMAEAAAKLYSSLSFKTAEKRFVTKDNKVLNQESLDENYVKGMVSLGARFGVLKSEADLVSRLTETYSEAVGNPYAYLDVEADTLLTLTESWGSLKFNDKGVDKLYNVDSVDTKVVDGKLVIDVVVTPANAKSGSTTTSDSSTTTSSTDTSTSTSTSTDDDGNIFRGAINLDDVTLGNYTEPSSSNTGVVAFNNSNSDTTTASSTTASSAATDEGQSSRDDVLTNVKFEKTEAGVIVTGKVNIDKLSAEKKKVLSELTKITIVNKAGTEIGSIDVAGDYTFRGLLRSTPTNGDILTFKYAGNDYDFKYTDGTTNNLPSTGQRNNVIFGALGVLTFVGGIAALVLKTRKKGSQ